MPKLEIESSLARDHTADVLIGWDIDLVSFFVLSNSKIVSFSNVKLPDCDYKPLSSFKDLEVRLPAGSVKKYFGRISK